MSKCQFRTLILCQFSHTKRKRRHRELSIPFMETFTCRTIRRRETEAIRFHVRALFMSAIANLITTKLTSVVDISSERWWFSMVTHRTWCRIRFAKRKQTNIPKGVSRRSIIHNSLKSFLACTLLSPESEHEKFITRQWQIGSNKIAKRDSCGDVSRLALVGARSSPIFIWPHTWTWNCNKIRSKQQLLNLPL